MRPCPARAASALLLVVRLAALVGTPMSSSQSSTERPLEPEFRAAQRGRLILDFVENGEHVHEGDDGWARIDGPWVHWFSEQQGYWQSWPLDKVVCVEWEKVDAPLF